MAVDETTIDSCSVGGCVGAVLIDDQPHATPGRVRPFVWSYLLLRGAVRSVEVEGALNGHVSGEDIRVIAEDFSDERSPLLATIESVLGEMVAQGSLRLANKDDGLYVLATAGAQQAVSLVCQLNAQLPDHLLAEIG
jgi:hypothetical protein